MVCLKNAIYVAVVLLGVYNIGHAAASPKKETLQSTFVAQAPILQSTIESYKTVLDGYDIPSLSLKELMDYASSRSLLEMSFHPTFCSTVSTVLLGSPRGVSDLFYALSAVHSAKCTPSTLWSALPVDPVGLLSTTLTQSTDLETLYMASQALLLGSASSTSAPLKISFDKLSELPFEAAALLATDLLIEDTGLTRASARSSRASAGLTGRAFSIASAALRVSPALVESQGPLNKAIQRLASVAAPAFTAATASSSSAASAATSLPASVALVEGVVDFSSRSSAAPSGLDSTESAVSIALLAESLSRSQHSTLLSSLSLVLRGSNAFTSLPYARPYAITLPSHSSLDASSVRLSLAPLFLSATTSEKINKNVEFLQSLSKASVSLISAHPAGSSPISVDIPLIFSKKSNTEVVFTLSVKELQKAGVSQGATNLLFRVISSPSLASYETVQRWIVFTVETKTLEASGERFVAGVGLSPKTAGSTSASTSLLFTSSSPNEVVAKKTPTVVDTVKEKGLFVQARLPASLATTSAVTVRLVSRGKKVSTSFPLARLDLTKDNKNKGADRPTHATTLSFSSAAVIRGLQGEDTYDIYVDIFTLALKEPIDAWYLGSAELKGLASVPGTAMGVSDTREDLTGNPLPKELNHTFTPPQKHVNPLLPVVFGSIIVLGGVVYIFSMIGAVALKPHTRSTPRPTSALLFMFTLTCMAAVIVTYWVYLNFFQAAILLALMAIPTVLAGHAALSYFSSEGIIAQSLVSSVPTTLTTTSLKKMQ